MSGSSLKRTSLYQQNVAYEGVKATTEVTAKENYENTEVHDPLAIPRVDMTYCDK